MDKPDSPPGITCEPFQSIPGIDSEMVINATVVCNSDSKGVSDEFKNAFHVQASAIR